MSLHWIGTWLLLLPLTAAAEPTNKYPRADLLIEAADLAKPEIAKQYRILDARGKNSYSEGHIPNAVWVDVTTWTRAAKDLQDRAAWENLIGGLGIDANSRVVVYGGELPSTARVWWLLRYWGIRDARLLNGGWKAWQQAGGPVSREVPTVPKTTVKLTPHPERLAFKDQLLGSLKDHSLQIVDTRSTPEYCGQAKTAERNGAIPGAIHREWSDLVNAQTGRFKSPAELAALLRESGIDAKRPTVTYCQSGGRAAVMAFALELMGLKDVRNYYRSWSEWGNAPDTPIVKPQEKK
jgi:thiosulfate/3-mercaptopyruvate sulfurtransferase